jgi:hypothetical protein
VITAANEISGLYFRKYKDSETHSNHVSALSSALKGLKGLVHANAKFYSYEGDNHLMDELTQTKKEFLRLQEKGEIIKEENFRHYINNLGVTVFSNLIDRLTNHAKYPAPLDKLEAIDRLWIKPLQFETLMLYFSFLENDGLETETVIELKDVLKRRKNGEIVRNSRINALARQFKGRNPFNAHLRSDKIVDTVDLLLLP